MLNLATYYSAHYYKTIAHFQQLCKYIAKLIFLIERPCKSVCFFRFTLFRVILGDFDFVSLQQASKYLGPIYFISYVFFVFFVLLNMFLAIINDTYSEVKEDLANSKSDVEFGDFFKRGYDKMLEKLNFKRDKIIDIQKAMVSADKDNDKKLDFDEMRNDLRVND